MDRLCRMHLFCTGILDWYAVHRRTLPWRDLKTKNLDHKAYLVLVSEVMLQQTQVPRVIILYKKFIQTFPLIEDLAKASNAEVLIAWRGLGYNSRALRLRDTAKAIVSQNCFPREMHDLQKLPGIGHYTAGAIRNFAFGIPTPCIDVNIRRILHRFFVGPENVDGTWKKDDAYLLKIAEEALATVMKGTVGVVGEEGEVGKGMNSVFRHSKVLTKPTLTLHCGLARCPHGLRFARLHKKCPQVGSFSEGFARVLQGVRQ